MSDIRKVPRDSDCGQLFSRLSKGTNNVPMEINPGRAEQDGNIVFVVTSDDTITDLQIVRTMTNQHGWREVCLCYDSTDAVDMAGSVSAKLDQVGHVFAPIFQMDIISKVYAGIGSIELLQSIGEACESISKRRLENNVGADSRLQKAAFNYLSASFESYSQFSLNLPSSSRDIAVHHRTKSSVVHASPDHVLKWILA